MTPVFIVVFDGLQPAQVIPELMPNLARLAAEGVTCNNHHAVFPTVTRANVASIVTGHQPGAHGLTGNMLVIPEFDPHHAIGALEPVLSEVAAKTPVLLQPTLGDILHRHGQEFIAVGTGTSGNAYLQNPNAETQGGATIHPDFCLPRPLHGEITARFGHWPDRRGPSAAKLARAVEIVTEYILAERQPAVSLLWLSEPDSSQHAHGVGSEEAISTIREADRQFGRLLEWLDKRGLSPDTNVIVVSDHGYSTISEVIDVEATLREAGFPPGDEPGGVAVAPNGGSVPLLRSQRYRRHRRAACRVADSPALVWRAGGIRCRREHPRNAARRTRRTGRPARAVPRHVFPLGFNHQPRRIRWSCLLHQPRPGARTARIHEPTRNPQRAVR